MSSRRPTVLQLWTEPDVHLLKQVEQVTILVLEGPARRFAQDSKHGDHRGRRGPRIYNSNCGFGCYFAAETARRGGDDRLGMIQSGTATGPARRFHEPGHSGFGASCSPDQVDSSIIPFYCLNRILSELDERTRARR